MWGTVKTSYIDIWVSFTLLLWSFIPIHQESHRTTQGKKKKHELISGWISALWKCQSHTLEGPGVVFNFWVAENFIASRDTLDGFPSEEMTKPHFLHIFGPDTILVTKIWRKLGRVELKEEFTAWRYWEVV
jgi:hypothetical protein